MWFLWGGEGGERGEREEKFKWRSLKERSKAFHIGKKVVPLTFPIKTLNSAEQQDRRMDNFFYNFDPQMSCLNNLHI